MKRPIEPKLAIRRPQKFFRFLRPKTNPEVQRIVMPPSFPSDKRSDTVIVEIGSSSSCACTAEKEMKKEAHLGDETIHQKTIAIPDYRPLHDAVRKGDEEMVSLHLKYKACVDHRSKYDLTPLHIAVNRGNLRIADILLDHGASVDAKCTLEGHSLLPLDLAIIGDHPRMVKLLLSHGSRESTSNYDWRSSQLEFSPDEGNNLISAYMLVSRLDRCNEKRRTSLLDAVDASMLEYRHIAGYLSFAPGNTDTTLILRQMLHYAVENGLSGVVEDLLIWGADIDIIDYRQYARHIEDRTLLHTAVINDRYGIAKLLVNHGADADATDATEKSPLSYAFESSNAKMMDLLLSNGDRECSELLLDAVKTGKSSEIVEIILRHDCDVNCRDEFRRTPLHLAIGHPKMLNSNIFDFSRGCAGDVVKLLLRHGADVNARDDNGQMPLLVAALSGNYIAVTTLLEYYTENRETSVNINSMGEHISRALVSAVETGHDKCIDILLKFGADVDYRREDGNTVLIRAVAMGHERFVEILLNRNADIEATNCSGSTALDVAFEKLSTFNEKAYAKIIELLLNGGADIAAINSLNSLVCTSERMPIFLQKYTVEMRVAGMSVDEKKFQCIFDSSTMKEHRELCTEEVERLKKKKICDSSVSLHDIVTKDSNRLASICRNDRITKTLETENYRETFQFYGRIIENNFRRGMKRATLVDRALKSFDRLIESECLDVLTADMLLYLGNDDLKNLAEA